MAELLLRPQNLISPSFALSFENNKVRVFCPTPAGEQFKPLNGPYKIYRDKKGSYISFNKNNPEGSDLKEPFPWTFLDNIERKK